jgi:predicted DNA-binding protein
MAKKPKPIEPPHPEEETIRFTVDLPCSMHLRFTILAALQRKSKAELVRAAIEQLLRSAEQ